MINSEKIIARLACEYLYSRLECKDLEVFNNLITE